jgi:UDP-N-acetylglucosamine 2-epimerase
VIVTTGRHGAVVIETWAHFGLQPHIDAAPDRDSSTLPELTSGLLEQLSAALCEGPWEIVVVQGDTAHVETVREGLARLVGTDPRIAAAEEQLATWTATCADVADGTDTCRRFAGSNPYGDGGAARRCAEACGWLLGLATRPAHFLQNHHETVPVAG